MVAASVVLALPLLPNRYGRVDDPRVRRWVPSSEVREMNVLLQCNALTVLPNCMAELGLRTVKNVLVSRSRFPVVCTDPGRTLGTDRVSAVIPDLDLLLLRIVTPLTEGVMSLVGTSRSLGIDDACVFTTYSSFRTALRTRLDETCESVRQTGWGW